MARRLYPRHALLALPFIRLELPGWGRAFAMGKIGGEHDALWADAPSKMIRGKYHGYPMDLDLRNWSERYSYFLGRFYDLGTQQVMRAAIRPGDRVVDVGANIGMITLLAARLVGESGRVEAFEPNPTCVRRIAAHLERNRIKHVTLHPCGLGDAEGRFTLTLAGEHTGTGTLGRVAPEQLGPRATEIPVAVGVGDEILWDESPVDFIKVDVEGFETRALRGLRGVLARWHPLVVTEVMGEWLERAGSSEAELVELMAGMGYEGYDLAGVRRRLRPGVGLKARGRAVTGEAADVLWVHPESRSRGRIARLILP